MAGAERAHVLLFYKKTLEGYAGRPALLIRDAANDPVHLAATHVRQVSWCANVRHRTPMVGLMRGLSMEVKDLATRG